MSHKDGRVVLSAWVDPALRDYAREAARLSGLEFSRWVARAVRQTMARESADRAMAAMGFAFVALQEEERNEANARADAAETALGNLLAILHRDGGHRLAEVGAEQAVREAHERWAEVVRRADAAEAARASLAGELAALRAAAHEAMRATSKQYSAARRALVTALADTRAAAEAHDAEVRREALREAAAMLDPVDGNSLECEDREDVPGWLRALASRERGQ